MTTTLAYLPPIQQIPAKHLRTDTCRYLRYAELSMCDADSPTRPHTYGVCPWSCPAIATEPCRPAACVRERPCSPNGESGLGETPSYRASAPAGAGDVGSHATVHCSLLTVHWSYTFSAKEKDSETGLSYFGSRYYSSDLSIWLSVDPQSDKYASLSPYTYCADNPVRCVDPNGEEIDDPPAWKRIDPVIPKELFVRWKQGDDYDKLKKIKGSEPNCNDFAKHQLSKVNCYTTGGGDSRTLYPYSETSGVNKEHARKSVDYIYGQLEKGIPVFVGVDEGVTSSKNNGTTDHFIVIVGQGSDKRGNYFLFYDNGTESPERGTSLNNKLYYNENTGKISGFINTRGVEQYYIISEVRITNRRKR